MQPKFPADGNSPAEAWQLSPNELGKKERRDPRAARDVLPGEPWVFPDHGSLAEVIAAEAAA